MVLKEYVERRIERKEKLRRVRKAYIDKCREILSLYYEMEDEAVGEGNRKNFSEELVRDCAQKVSEQCMELHQFYVYNEPSFLTVKKLKKREEQITGLGKRIKSESRLLLEGNIEMLLLDSIRVLEKRNKWRGR